MLRPRVEPTEVDAVPAALIDAGQPKSDDAGTPLYHRLSAPLDRFTRVG